jgi:3-hydroxyisobutyrate dehydrogenase-like beta-hydroxyacid dehydrogenase
MDIGFAGVGRMGRHFALHLARAGHRVIGYDPVVRLDDELASAGIRLVDDVAAIAATPLSISMLPDAASARLLLKGATGLFAATAPGHRHVLMGTMGVAVVQELLIEAERYGVVLADAPVSGSVAAARARTLTTMVGATAELFGELRPLLAEFTRAQVHVGPVGSGNVVKLAVNVVVGAVNESVAEALLLATKAGVDRNLFYEVLQASAGGGTYVDYKKDAFLAVAEPPVDAPVTLIHKDLTLAGELAERLGIRLPGAAADAAVLAEAIARGHGGVDLSRIGLALESDPPS